MCVSPNGTSMYIVVRDVTQGVGAGGPDPPNSDFFVKLVSIFAKLYALYVNFTPRQSSDPPPKTSFWVRA